MFAFEAHLEPGETVTAASCIGSANEKLAFETSHGRFGAATIDGSVAWLDTSLVVVTPREGEVQLVPPPGGWPFVWED